MKYTEDALAVAGLACITIAGFLVHIALGFLFLGLAFLTAAFFVASR